MDATSTVPTLPMATLAPTHVADETLDATSGDRSVAGWDLER